MLRFRSSLLALIPLLFLPGASIAQAAAQPDTDAPAPTLKINARTVLVDVVVMDKAGKAVPGLKKEDFEVSENGATEKIDYFEPHFAASPVVTPKDAPLPPNTFTNVPAVSPNEAVNVLLMDALNTQTTDQLNVRLRMVKYLDQVPAGVRVAVFMLSEKLRIVQGFTDDPAVLHAALKRYAPNASTSALAGSPAATAAQSSSLGMITSSAAETANALDEFMKNQANFEKNSQLLVTLDSLQTIASYLSGVPGRKNLVWFVGSFPLCVPVLRDCPFDEKLEKTVTMLAEARVSVYPIDAGGVVTPGIYSAETPNGGTGFLSVEETRKTDERTRGFQLINSETWAEKTGGKAYHNNDIKGEMAEAIENGSRYYTLAYTPHGVEGLGRERKIEVRIPAGKYNLSYRRNYFEQNRKELKASEEAPATDRLRPLMDRGMPSFSQLHYRVKVEPVAQQPLPDAARAGDNPALKGPFTRYRVTFQLEPGGLSLVPGPDGVRRGSVEVALIAYSQQGVSLNWQVRSVGLAIRSEQIAIAESSGIPLHFDFDVPAGDVFLRTGVYDASTSKAGTLEIPLGAIVLPSARSGESSAPLPASKRLPATKRVTVQTLEQLVSGAKVRPDKDVAHQLAEMELTERLSTSRLEQFEAQLPGEQARQALLALGDASAFLDPPASEVLKNPVPDRATQGQVLSRAVDFVQRTTLKMPDFLARRTTTRYRDAKPSPIEGDVVVTPQIFHLLDKADSPVRYRNGKEEEGTDDPKKGKDIARPQSGLHSWGMFGPLLELVMTDILKAKIGWSRWEQSPSGPVAVFRYAVQRNQSSYTVRYCCVRAEFETFREFQAIVQYHGEIAVEPNTGTVVRLAMISDLEPRQPVLRADVLVEYGPIEINGKSYTNIRKSIAIFTATALVEHEKRRINGEFRGQAITDNFNVTAINDLAFDNYHVFGSEMRVLPAESAETDGNPPAFVPPQSQAASPKH